MENKERKDELVSLNDKLYDEFYLQELEERLETDPLLIGGLLDLFSDTQGDMSIERCVNQCNEQSICIPNW